MTCLIALKCAIEGRYKMKKAQENQLRRVSTRLQLPVDAS